MVQEWLRLFVCTTKVQVMFACPKHWAEEMPMNGAGDGPTRPPKSTMVVITRTAAIEPIARYLFFFDNTVNTVLYVH
jgi:hypothetical protein